MQVAHAAALIGALISRFLGAPDAQAALPAPHPVASPAPPALPPGGAIPRSVTVTVTGSPVDPDFLATQIRAALDRAVLPTLKAGARVDYGTTMTPMVALDPGFIRSLRVPVTISGTPQSAPVSGTTEVDLTNLSVPPFEPPVLYFDDDPESIVSNGVLFRGTVDRTRPARLYYYHENRATPRRFLVMVAGTSALASRVQVISAGAGPNADVMSVGHASSRDFVMAKQQNEGIVMNVAPNAPYVVRDETLDVSQGVAGIVDVHVLDGGPVNVVVLALGPSDDPASYLAAPRLPGDGHERHGTFDIGGFGDTVLAYTTGGPDASMSYGAGTPTPPNLDPSDVGRDHGDYGVMRHIRFDLANPSNGNATVYLYERPMGGVARGSFLVDGNLKDVGCVRMPWRYEIARYDLPPHSNTISSVITMTDGGSNYPLELGITATPPLPMTPPIDAPDGCFPKRAASQSE